MPLNLIKKYPELLEIGFLSIPNRIKSLRGIFDRDITNNLNFKFDNKQIRPIKKEGESSMDTLFHHLTTSEDKDDKGKKIGSRSYEPDRSRRLHWLKFHIEKKKPNNIVVFSYEDRIKRRDIIRTYIYDKENNYVIVLEPQRSKTDYYLLTAYYLNKPDGKKQIKNKLRKSLDEVY